MRMRKSNNSGMTLVEVLVSMLVLSIAVVTVMTTFSMASKVNLKSEQMQSVESLMENLMEYAEAGGTDFEAVFLSSSGTAGTPTVSGSKTIQELSSVRQGFYDYKVRITTDTEPTDYATANLNDHGVLQFGGSNSNTVMLDVSKDKVSFADDIAMIYFSSQHAQAVDDYNAEELEKKILNPTYPAQHLDVTPEANIWTAVTNELWLMTESPNPGKVTLCAYMVYDINPAALEYPDDADTRYFVFLWRSEEYDAEGTSDPDPKKLNQMYLLCTDFGEPTYSMAQRSTQDIRILDMVGSSIDTSFFFVIQEKATMELTSAVNAANFESRITDGSSKYLNISFRNPAESGTIRLPKATRIYSTSRVTLDSADSTVKSPNDLNPTAPLSIVAKGEEVRVVTVTFEILDANSGAVLESQTLTRLQ